MRRSMKALLPLTLFCVLGSSALANDQAACESKADSKLDSSIAACGRLIKSGKLAPQELSIAFFNRGTHFGLDYYRGNMNGGKGDLDRAIADFAEAIRLNPTFADALLSRGDQFAAKGQTEQFYIDKGQSDRKGRMIAYFERAIVDYDQAIRLRPQNADFHCYRALAYSMKGDFDRAIADYDEAIRLDPRSASSFEDRGRVQAKKGALERAIVDFEAALRLNPQDVDSAGDLANVRAALAAKAH